MFSRRKWYGRGLLVLMFSVFLLACELPSVFADILLSDTAEDRCFEDGGIWYYNEETGKWMCAPGVDIHFPIPPVESESAEVDTSVPDGTYVGATTLPEFWDDLSGGHWQGAIEKNEITIIVSETGSVSGAIIVIRVGDKSTPIDGCTSQINLYVEGSLSGQLDERGGTIEIDMIRTEEIWRSGCPSGTETKTENGNVQAQVSIIGNQVIKGDVPNYFSFEAMKR